jgi:hypothetical protein
LKSAKAQSLNNILKNTKSMAKKKKKDYKQTMIITVKAFKADKESNMIKALDLTQTQDAGGRMDELHRPLHCHCP